jgi:hypothetical protein
MTEIPEGGHHRSFPLYLRHVKVAPVKKYDGRGVKI